MCLLGLPRLTLGLLDLLGLLAYLYSFLLLLFKTIKMSEVPEVPVPPAFNLTELDHKLLAMTDEEFVYHDWEDLKSIIGKCSHVLQFYPRNNSPHVIYRNSAK